MLVTHVLIFLVLAECSLSASGNFMDSILNFPSKLWNSMTNTWNQMNAKEKRSTILPRMLPRRAELLGFETEREIKKPFSDPLRISEFSKKYRRKKRSNKKALRNTNNIKMKNQSLVQKLVLFSKITPFPFVPVNPTHQKFKMVSSNPIDAPPRKQLAHATVQIMRRVTIRQVQPESTETSENGRRKGSKDNKKQKLKKRLQRKKNKGIEYFSKRTRTISWPPLRH